MQTECNQDSFEFASLRSRKVTAAFDGGAMTSNAGDLLLRETDRILGLSRERIGNARRARPIPPRQWPRRQS